MTRKTPVPTETELMVGADPISAFLRPDTPPKKRRRWLYHVVSRGGPNAPPIFRIGATLAARRSALLAWLAEQERAVTT